MVPEHLRYTETHEWIQIDGHTATVGITHYAQEQLTDIVFVELPSVGQDVSKSGECGVIESCKVAADFYAPLSGTITAINEELRDHPENINHDAYGKGWIIKMEMTDPSEAESLLDAASYKEHIEKD